MQTRLCLKLLFSCNVTTLCNKQRGVQLSRVRKENSDTGGSRQNGSAVYSTSRGRTRHHTSDEGLLQRALQPSTGHEGVNVGPPSERVTSLLLVACPRKNERPSLPELIADGCTSPSELTPSPFYILRHASRRFKDSLNDSSKVWKISITSIAHLTSQKWE